MTKRVNKSLSKQPQVRLIAILTVALLAMMPTCYAATAADAWPTEHLARIDRFIFAQMDKIYTDKPPGQPPFAQTYDCFSPANLDNYFRGDVYDNGAAIIYLLQRGQIARAQRLADALLFLLDRDPISDGRLHAAYWPNDLLNKQGTSTSIKDPNIAPGNMSWAGIGLLRTFVATGEEKYYLGAARIADWILANLKREDGPGGFTGGLEGWDYRPVEWRGTEHNVGIYALAACLYNVSHESKWHAMAEHARKFVSAMYTDSPAPGHFFTGTLADGITINPTPLPADCQAWTALAGGIPLRFWNRTLADHVFQPLTDTNEQVRLCSREQATNALNWLWQNLRTDCTVGTNTFGGIKFSDRGSGISTEQTAGAAMSLWQYRHSSEAEELLQNLRMIQDAAPSCQTNGLVAAPCDGCTATGFGNCIPNRPHVASSAWSGLAALVVNGDPKANPLMPIPTPLHVSNEGGMLHFWWPSLSFKSYSILVSTDVGASLTNWTAIPVGQTNRWTNPVQSGYRFYCLKVH